MTNIRIPKLRISTNVRTIPTTLRLFLKYIDTENLQKIYKGSDWEPQFDKDELANRILYYLSIVLIEGNMSSNLNIRQIGYTIKCAQFFQNKTKTPSRKNKISVRLLIKQIILQNGIFS